MTCHRLGRRDLVSIHSFTSAQLAGLHFSLFSSCGGWKHRITTFSLYFEQLGLSARACLDLPSFGVKMSKARNRGNAADKHSRSIPFAGIGLPYSCMPLSLLLGVRGFPARQFLLRRHEKRVKDNL